LTVSPGPDLRQDGVDLVGSIMGKQEGRGPADDLLAGVAIHRLGGRVPARDDALERVADNGIAGLLHDRRDELRVRVLGATRQPV
jgi:hypothetical protein